jgi:Uma2 family endonuclease
MIHEVYLEERHERGHDRFDEVWGGVLHMVPPPTSFHQRLEMRLANLLDSIATKRSLIVLHESGLYNPAVLDDSDFRVPDIVVARREAVSRRGIEGKAEIAVEIRSPRDESYEKLPFYAEMGVREVWIIDQEKRSIEVYAGTRLIAPVGGVIGAHALGLELEVVGHVLKIKDGADLYEVDISDAI